jgi:DNA-binding NtrC family response regulator
MSLPEHFSVPQVREHREIRTMEKPSKRMALVAQDRAEAACTAELLDRLGWGVAVVSSWSEAERLLSERHFDVMVTDYDLAGGDGLSLVTKWREQEIRLRVLFVSDVPIESSVPVEQLGFCGLLVKPFFESGLRKALGKVLRLRGNAGPEWK